jgi:hypothetical protein
VHQFTKVESFAIRKPEASEAMHGLLAIEEELYRGLGSLPRGGRITGDLGAPAFRKVRPRSLDDLRARRGLGRDHQHLELHRLPGTPARRSLP